MEFVYTVMCITFKNTLHHSPYKSSHFLRVYLKMIQSSQPEVRDHSELLPYMQFDTDNCL